MKHSLIALSLMLAPFVLAALLLWLTWGLTLTDALSAGLKLVLRP